MEHVRWLAQPTLRNPTIIAAFTGWNDAGDAASNGVRQFIEGWNAAPLGEIDPEEFTDFATVRPHVRLTAEKRRTIVWPTVTLWSASTPGGDVILLLGPEPALRWRLFCEQILGVAKRYDSPMLVTMGALLADVPHTRPVRVMGTATDQQMIDRFDLQRSTYEGPTGIVGVLQDMCLSEGMSTASLWAAVPAYAAQVSSPKAALALIERTADIVGCPAPTGALPDQSLAYERQVTALAEADSDIVEYVQRLEQMADDGEMDDVDDDDSDDRGDDASARPAPSSEDLVAEVERFLRDQGST
ncbi:MAG TPA: PAC2 family protein [Ilumatobacteraceae bacterium]|nr:PAC2 family protein [Ilumatobacteraceae bacterium]